MKILPVDPFRGLADFQAAALGGAGTGGGGVSAGERHSDQVVQVVCQVRLHDSGNQSAGDHRRSKVIAAASLMAVDDCAMYRHPELSDMVQIGSDRAWRPLTALEKQVVEVNEADPYRGTARYTEIDGGDIGFMCGGGGGSLMMFDALLSYGGKPANYTEFGGNPPEQKVFGLVKGILSKPGVEGLSCRQYLQQYASRCRCPRRGGGA